VHIHDHQKGRVGQHILELPTAGKVSARNCRQRLLTTKPEDLNDFEENIFEVGDGENIFVDAFED